MLHGKEEARSAARPRSVARSPLGGTAFEQVGRGAAWHADKELVSSELWHHHRELRA